MIRIALLCALLAASPALAGQCAPYGDIADALQRDLAAYPAWQGIAANGQSITELWLGAQGWSLLVVWPDGMACLVGAGTGWEEIDQPKGDPA